jgi:predicted Zn-dependent peptidase
MMTFSLTPRRALGSALVPALLFSVTLSAAIRPASAQDSTFDRSKPPTVPTAKSLTFPQAQTRTLANGIPITILEDHHSPVVSVQAVVRVSSQLDPAGKTGLGDLTEGMLDEGTTTHTAEQLADAFAELGNTVGPTGFYTITANVDRSLELMAEQLRTPSFPQTALDRTKANVVAQIQRAKESPGYLANRVFSSVVYGKDHPYSRVQSESETMSITRDDVVSFYNTYIRPPNVQFVVAGDITPDQAVEKLNRVFGDWTKGTSGEVPVPAPAGVSQTQIYLYDRPASPQSTIVVGNIGPQRTTPDLFPIKLMNVTLGGAFTSRINLNLREEHQYTYGASSRFSFRRPPEVSTFSTATAVATPKTDSAVIEIMKELRDIRGSRPITAAEFAFAKSSETAGLPLQFETIGQRARAVAGLVASEEPLDYYNTVIPRYNAVTLAQAQAAAAKYIDPAKLAIVVVGDRKVIEPALKAANIAPIVIVDSF